MSLVSGSTLMSDKGIHPYILPRCVNSGALPTRRLFLPVTWCLGWGSTLYLRGCYLWTILACWIESCIRHGSPLFDSACGDAGTGLLRCSDEWPIGEHIDTSIRNQKCLSLRYFRMFLPAVSEIQHVDSCSPCITCRFMSFIVRIWRSPFCVFF
jgi:hypothetical protein